MLLGFSTKYLKFQSKRSTHQCLQYLKNAPVGEDHDVLEDCDDPEAEQAIQSGQSKNTDCRFKQGKQADQ